MKFSILALSFLVSVPAFAAVTTLECQLASLPGETFSFKIENLGSDDADFVSEDPTDDYAKIFSTTSKNPTIESMIGSLEGQGGDLRVSDDRIAFFGDAAGIDFVDLVLFEKTGFEKGFVRWDFAGDKGYSKLSCSLN